MDSSSGEPSISGRQLALEIFRLDRDPRDNHCVPSAQLLVSVNQLYLQRHNDEVQQAIAPERLLVWNASDGWEPLCEFLEVPVPGVPFPHINDRTEFLNRIIDGSIASLQEWRARQGSVEPAFAVES